jgi:hypothetical protein
MDSADDRNAPPTAPETEAPKRDASGAFGEREARLAAALRANLRKRKAAPRQPD